MGVINNNEGASYSVTPTGITIGGRTKTYATYADMLADPSPGKYAQVQDATVIDGVGDSTVKGLGGRKGAAYERVQNADKSYTWKKIYELEAMDVETTITLQDLGISATGEEIDDAVGLKHEHIYYGTEDTSNKTALDKLNINADDKLVMKNKDGVEVVVGDTTAIESDIDALKARATSAENHAADSTIHVTAENKTAWNNKVDKVDGKGLSTNDYTDVDKAIVDGVTNNLAAKQDKDEDAVENNLAKFDANGNSVDAGVKVGGDTLAGTDGLLATEKAAKAYAEAQASAAQSAAETTAATALSGHTDTEGIHVSETDRATWNGKASASDLTDHTGNADIHVTATDKSNWNAYATSKVDKVEGKQLSTEDFTTALKTKLDGLSGVFRWKGSCTWAELQAKTENEVGDVWQVTDKDNEEYAWTGSEWQKLGSNVDLSTFAKAADVKEHTDDAVIHITAAERESWNNKAGDISGKMDKDTDAVAGNIPTLVSGGNVEDSGKSIGGATLAATPAETVLATEAAVAAADATKLSLDGSNALSGTLFMSEKLTQASGAKDKPRHKMKITTNPVGNGIFSFDYTNSEDSTVSTYLEMGSTSDYIVTRSYAAENYAGKTTTETALGNKLDKDGSIAMTDDLVLRKATVDDSDLLVHVGAVPDTTTPASSTINFKITNGTLQLASSALTPDGSVVLTQNLGDARYALSSDVANKLDKDGSVAMTEDLVLKAQGSGLDLTHLNRVKVGAVIDSENTGANYFTFTNVHQLDETTSQLHVDGSRVLTKTYADGLYAEKESYDDHVDDTDIHHTHDNKALLDTMAMTNDVFTVNGKEISGGLKVDESCVALSDLTTTLGRNNVAGGYPMEVVGYNVLSEHRYAWYNSSTSTTLYTTKVDTSSYVQFYTATGTTSVAGKGKGTKDSTLVEPDLVAWTATGNVTNGTIAYAYRNADSGVIFYCNTASASTSTAMYTNHAYTGTAVNPTAASGSPRVVTIGGTQYTYTAAYNKVTVFTETDEPSKTATGTALYYYTNTYNTSGSTLNATTVVIAEDFSTLTISSVVYTRDTTKDYAGRGEFARDVSKDDAGSSIIRVVPIGGALRSDDRFKSIYYKNASGTMTDINSNLATYMKKGVFGLVSNSNLTAYLSYAFRNADNGKIYFCNTTTPTTSTAMYLDYGLTGTSVKPTAYSTASPRTVTIDSVVYSYDATYNQFTTSKFINCTKDLWTLIEKVLSTGSAAYVRLYQLDGPSKSGWNANVQNWWCGTCLYNTSYSTFYNNAAANDGQPKDGSGQWKLYYKIGETEQYVLMTSAPSADNSNKSRPTEQSAWFDIYTQAGGILLSEDDQKSFGLQYADGTKLKCIAEAVVPVNNVYRDIQKSDGTVVITAAQCEAGLYMKEDNNLRKVTKYDQKEIFETALFDDGVIYIHPTMNSAYGLANLKFTFSAANVVPQYEAPSTTNTTDAEDPAMIGAVIKLNSDIIDPNNIDTILSLDPGSMSDPAMAVIASPKRGYTAFVDGECNSAIGYNSMVTGNSNEVYGDWSVCTGLHNIVAGMMASASGDNNIVFADSGFAAGGSNKIYGSANFGTGVSNMMYGYDGIAVGSRNQTFGVNNMAVGFSNEIYASRVVSVGTRNRAYEKGNDSILIGNNLKNYAPKAMALGAYGVINAVDGTRPEDTSVTIQMPIYGLPIQLNKNNISTYVGQSLYMTNSTLATGTYTQTTITSSHVGRWVILPNDADKSGIENKNGAFLCMGDYEKNDEDALCVMGYTKYRWSVNNAYFAATVGTTGRSGLEPYICEPFHQWNFTGVMKMKFTEATALDSKYESWELTTRDGGRIKTFDPGKVQEDTSIANYYVDFDQATRWKIKAGTNLVLFPRNFVDGAEAYIVIYAGKTVSWSGFTNGEDTGVGANQFDSLVWVGGSAPTTDTFTTGFALVKLMIVDNVCIAETIANTLA